MFMEYFVNHKIHKLDITVRSLLDECVVAILGWIVLPLAIFSLIGYLKIYLDQFGDKVILHYEEKEKEQ